VNDESAPWSHSVATDLPGAISADVASSQVDLAPRCIISRPKCPSPAWIRGTKWCLRARS